MAVQLQYAAFMFIADGADPKASRVDVAVDDMLLTTIGVSGYAQAAQVADELASAGYCTIELCGGFGIRGVYEVMRAVEGRAKVGVVRFDLHPDLNNMSGDSLY